MPGRVVETEVLIVGAGPIGMALGIDLRLRGIDALVLDAGDGRLDHPRVGTVGARSMELFRRWGLSEKVRTAGWPDDHSLDIAWVTALNGHEIYRIKFGTNRTREPSMHSPEAEQVCPQHWLNPLLGTHLAELGDPVRFHHRVDGINEDSSGVRARVSTVDSGEAFTVLANYVAACDGAGSPIRESFGVRSPARYRAQKFRNILFRAPLLSARLGQRQALVYFLTSPQMLRYPLRAMDGRDLFRLTASGQDESTSRAPEQLVRMALGFDIPFEILNDADWLLTHQVAEQYRAGRVFFVGDAAHTLSPSGGFGMNTGIADAADLGWKLAAVHEGWAYDGILDSFQDERQPIAVLGLEQSQRNLERTLTRLLPSEIADDSPVGAQIRERMRRQFEEGGVHREFDAPDLHFGYRYQSTLIDSEVADDIATNSGGSWFNDAVLGGRAPHAWLADGRSTLDLYGRGFVLLSTTNHGGGDEVAEAFAARGVPLEVRNVTEVAVTKVYPAHTLVRPDGHVAWRGRELPSRPGMLADRVRGAI